MNILILSPYPPYPPHGGGAMRIYQLIRGLAVRHEVTCLTFAPDPAAERGLAPLQALCRTLAVPGPSPRGPLRRAWTTLASPLPDMALRNAALDYAAALSALLAAERFDIVQAESIEMAGYLPTTDRRPTTDDQRPMTDRRPTTDDRRPRVRRQADKQTSRQADKEREQSAICNLQSAISGSNGQRTTDNGQRGNTQYVLDQFNAEFVLQRRAFLAEARRLRRWHAAGYSLVQWLKLARYERRVLRACDGALAVSEEDRRTLLRLAPGVRIGVVPNGVDTAHFSRAALARERAGPLSLAGATLVFSGTLDFRPNVDAVAWFVREALPQIRARRPEVRLLVVGRRPAPALRALAAEGALVLTGEVPDARPYIAGAAVYVVPMRIGGGVRLKLLEALSLEAAVVSTGMGAEGIGELRGGEHCLLADSPVDFAHAVLRLLDDTALGRRLGAAGRALVRERYDWSAIVPRLEGVYQGLGQRLGEP
jgi:polysaccharide biosynthesis protein PslH